MNYAESVLEGLRKRDADQPEFLQAVSEVLETITPLLNVRPEYEKNAILERIVEPERVIMFRVPWVDDQGKVQVNRGYRVQFNSAIGPYKGGIRFDGTVNLSILKFLGFEQTFKNSLTTLPMGGGKGGADFAPRGKSEGEVMRFCQSFMTELYRHIGQFTDVPAGDMGVGGREVAYMFGQYKRIANEFTGVLTGKGLSFGGSLIRPEATGYGDVYFAQNMLATRGDDLSGKICLVSGAGNVATYAVEKLIELGACPVTLSDRSGTFYMKSGITREILAEIMQLKGVKRGELADLKIAGSEFFAGANPWKVADKVDCAFPCSRQNELKGDDAEYLLAHGCQLVGEGANMPSTPDAVNAFLEKKILFSPGKASNAGGVSVSGLEMSQNSERLSWSAEEVDSKLKSIMKNIHDNAFSNAAEFGCEGNYVAGANIAGFRKVADAMLAQGVC